MQLVIHLFGRELLVVAYAPGGYEELEPSEGYVGCLGARCERSEEYEGDDEDLVPEEEAESLRTFGF